MNEFLRRIKLIDDFSVELEVERNVFVDRLMSIVDPGGTGTIFTSFEGFSSNRKEYKGKVGNDGFEIRRRKKLFDTNMNLAIAKGKWRQRENHLIVETEVNSFNNFFILFIVILLGFYAFGVVALLLSNNGTDESNMGMAIGLPFLLVHAAFMLGIPYLVIRRSTNRMKYDLTREFHYLAATKNSPQHL
ncbi:MAG TPA: hypothetical protein VK589_03015 [Chryseolinea sp.]|nr:hypothetical protein [Chryseolinea sp.]